jgi:hypothetical protein
MLAGAFADTLARVREHRVLVLLLFGPAAFALAAALAGVLGRTSGRLVALVAAGPLLAAVWFLIAYLSAPTQRPVGDTCADCGYTLGRWWELGFFAFILVLNVIAWELGVAVGTVYRWLAARRSPSMRPKAA